MWETPVWFLHGKIPWRRDKLSTTVFLGFPAGSAGKKSACNAGDLGSIPGLGRSPEEGNSYAFKYSGLENSMDRGAWQATVHGVTKSQTQLSDFYFHFQSYLGSSVSKEPAWTAGDPGSTPGLGISPEEGNGNPLQYSCLEKFHGWRSLAGYGLWCPKSWTWLSD